MTKGVILIVRAKGCVPCQQFTPYWDKFKDNLLKKTKDFKIVDIHVSSVNDPQYDSTGLPPLGMAPNGYIGSFPAVFLFTMQEWEKSILSNSKPNGRAIRHIINPDKIDEFIKEAERLMNIPFPQVQPQVKKQEQDDVCSTMIKIVGYRTK